MINESLYTEQEKKDVLYFDATKVTAGFIGEHFFEKTFLEAKEGISYTNNWFYCRRHNGFDVFLFCLKEELNDVDKELWELLDGKIGTCFQVYFDKGLKFVRNGLIDDEKWFEIHNYLGNSDGIRYVGKHNDFFSIVAGKSSKNPEFFKEYIDYMQETGIFNDVFLNRYFCNAFATHHFVCCDLDYIVKMDNKLPFVVDVKFKYPDWSNAFGINKEPANIYTKLNSFLDIYDFNFLKPKINYSDSLLSFIQKSSNSMELYVYKVNPKDFCEENFHKGNRNQNTGFSGGYGTDYYSINVNKFRSFSLDLKNTPDLEDII